jgi:hypothetical protein
MNDLRREVLNQIDRKLRIKEKYQTERDEEEEQQQPQERYGATNISLITGLDNSIKVIIFVLVIAVTFGSILWGLKVITTEKPKVEKKKKNK